MLYLNEKNLEEPKVTIFSGDVDDDMIISRGGLTSLTSWWWRKHHKFLITGLDKGLGSFTSQSGVEILTVLSSML